MLADEYPDYDAFSPSTLGGSPVKMHLYVDDVDAFVERAVSAGAKIIRPVEDQFYGDRAGQTTRSFGYTWTDRHPEKQIVHGRNPETIYRHEPRRRRSRQWIRSKGLRNAPPRTWWRRMQTA